MSNNVQEMQTQDVGERNSSPNFADSNKPIFTYASIDLNNSSSPYRCFMTGEFCSMQNSIARERRELHRQSNNKINAFVVMNFSNVADVVYKWRIKPFVESLQKNLYFNCSHTRLYCFSLEETSTPVLDEIITKEPFSQEEFLKILKTGSFQSKITTELLDHIESIFKASEAHEIRFQDFSTLVDNYKRKKENLNSTTEPEKTDPLTIEKALFSSLSEKQQTETLARLINEEREFFWNLTDESKTAIIGITENSINETKKDYFMEI